MPDLLYINRSLRGFAEADTRSPAEGDLGPGLYEILDRRVDHPDADSDYCRVAVPRMAGGDTWLCTRWKATRYAEVVPPGGRVSFEDDPAAIPESAITGLLGTFAGWDYSRDDPRYPWPLPGVNVPLADNRLQNNCCTLVEALVVHAWAKAVTGFNWNKARHGQMMVDGADYYSPATALIEAGMAIAVPDTSPPPQPWTVVQGWAAGKKNGHCFIIVDHHPATGRVLLLESTNRKDLGGVGWRGIGRMTAAPAPGEWWNVPGVPTWAEVAEKYPERGLATLRVRGRSFSGIDA